MLQGRLKRKKYLKLINNNINIYIYILIYILYCQALIIKIMYLNLTSMFLIKMLLAQISLNF